MAAAGRQGWSGLVASVGSAEARGLGRVRVGSPRLGVVRDSRLVGGTRRVSAAQRNQVRGREGAVAAAAGRANQRRRARSVLGTRAVGALGAHSVPLLALARSALVAHAAGLSVLAQERR